MSFATEQVERLETLLAENAGVQSVNVDGQQVTFADLVSQYDYWKSRVAREEGTRPRTFSVDLSSF